MPIVKLAKTKKKSKPKGDEVGGMDVESPDKEEVQNAVKKNSTMQNFLPSLDFFNMSTPSAPIKITKKLTDHELKEQEIIEESIANPKRRIHLVEQKSEVQKKLEEKFSF